MDYPVVIVGVGLAMAVALVPVASELTETFKLIACHWDGAFVCVVN
jgi:hypothetical protein